MSLLFDHKPKTPQRVNSKTELNPGDEVLFCRKLIRLPKGKTYYCPHTASLSKTFAPVDLRYGVVLDTTERGGVWLFVTSHDDEQPSDFDSRWFPEEGTFYDDGMIYRRHPIPRKRVWAVTGETFRISAEMSNASYSDRFVEWYTSRKGE